MFRLVAVGTLAAAAVSASFAAGVQAASGPSPSRPHSGGVTPRMNGHWVDTWVAAPQLTEPGNMPQAVRDPASPRQILPSFDSGDHLHLNPEGYRGIADAVPASLFRPAPLPWAIGFS